MDTPLPAPAATAPARLDTPASPRYLSLAHLVPPPLPALREPGINLRLTSVRNPPWNPEHALAMQAAEGLLGVCVAGFAGLCWCAMFSTSL
jgi:hypothetical protein